MIDVSTMAPVSGLPTPAAGTSGVVPGGAAGFLRLFEIVLGGMPGVAAGAVSPDPVGATSEASAGAAVPTAIPGLLETAPASTDAGIASVDAAKIAQLLGLLGFQVSAADIQSLGAMDRFQLDQAMEFLQRGVAANASPSALLENAGYLMPGEWTLQDAATAAPRAAGLAPADFASESVDPAAILAMAESVRALLAPTLVGGEVASLRGDAGSAGAPVVSAMVDGGNALLSADPIPAPVAGDIPGAVAANLPMEASADAAPVASADADVVEASAAAAFESLLETGIRPRAPVPTHPAGRAAHAEAPEGAEPAPKASVAAEGIVVAPRRGAKADATSLPSAGPARPGAVGSETATPLVAAASNPVRTFDEVAQTRGVKPGSMASEFIGRQVLEKVDVQLRQGRRELSVRLWPEELGEVRLSLRVGEADRLDARILVQTESVRQAILDATPQLREALSRHGMEMGRLSVNVDSGATDSRGGDGTADRERPRGGNERQRPSPDWRDDTVAYASSLALGVDSGIRDGRNTLDMWS